MSSKHRITASCPFADSDDGIEVEITFNFTPGAGPTGPSYSSGGEPGYAAEVELVSVKPVDAALVLPPALQKVLNEWADLWLADDGYYDALNRADADLEPDPDRMRDMRIDDQLTER